MKLSAIHSLAEALPFHLDDSAAANALFQRWHAHRAHADKRLVDLWTYCYVYRYFLIKLSTARQRVPVAFDQLVASAFDDVQKHLGRVRQPERYTGWVGTICYNTFINYLRMRRATLALDDALPVLDVASPPYETHHDVGVVYEALCSAIEALPPYLRTPARRRLLENRSYETISQETGRSMATLRAYVNKALALLRTAPALQQLLEELRD